MHAMDKTENITAKDVASSTLPIESIGVAECNIFTKYSTEDMSKETEIPNSTTKIATDAKLFADFFKGLP